MNIYTRWKEYKAERDRMTAKHAREKTALYNSFFDRLLYKGKKAIVAGVIYGDNTDGEDTVMVREDYDSLSDEVRFNDLEWVE